AEDTTRGPRKAKAAPTEALASTGTGRRLPGELPTQEAFQEEESDIPSRGRSTLVLSPGSSAPKCSTPTMLPPAALVISRVEAPSAMGRWLAKPTDRVPEWI